MGSRLGARVVGDAGNAGDAGATADPADAGARHRGVRTGSATGSDGLKAWEDRA
jgi:hypothetical protein